MHASQESSVSSTAVPPAGDKGKKRKGRKGKKAAEAFGAPFKALSRAISGRHVPACLRRYLPGQLACTGHSASLSQHGGAPVHAGHSEIGDWEVTGQCMSGCAACWLYSRADVWYSAGDKR